MRRSDMKRRTWAIKELQNIIDVWDRSLPLPAIVQANKMFVLRKIEDGFYIPRGGLILPGETLVILHAYPVIRIEHTKPCPELVLSVLAPSGLGVILFDQNHLKDLVSKDETYCSFFPV